MYNTNSSLILRNSYAPTDAAADAAADAIVDAVATLVR